MKLRAIKIDKRYIPKWNGNRELSPGEQIIIHFTRIPGTSEKSNYKGFSFDSTGAIKLNYNDNMMAGAFVQRIENFELDDGTKIKDGKDLASMSHPAVGELLTEIRDYLFPDDEDFQPGESKA